MFLAIILLLLLSLNTALEISFDNPVLHRNWSDSFEDEDDDDEHEDEGEDDDEHEDEGFMLIPSDQDA